MLVSVVQRCLIEADEHFCCDIAFPALGVGTLQYPATIVANAMYDTIEFYGKSHPETCVRNVFFAILKSEQSTRKVIQITS